MSSQTAGRRRSNNRQYSAEDQALNMISKEAEARLAAKRAARAEARDIRMKEMEKQQKDTEDKQDRIYELTNEHAAAKIRQQISGSRRGSVDSVDSFEGKDMDFKAEIRELEDKYKAAMMTSAQLDNEKQSLVYQVELLKDQLEEQDEGYTELQREYKDKCREFELQKRDLKSVQHELSILKQQLELKDRLIQESGFVIMANDRGEPVLEKQSSSPSATSSNGPLPTGAFLVSPETKEFLERAGDGTLGTPVVSNITTDKSVVCHASKSRSDQPCSQANKEESSKCPVTDDSEKEKNGEMGEILSGTENAGSSAKIGSVNEKGDSGSSNRTKEEVHDRLDGKGESVESKLGVGMNNEGQSETHAEEETKTQVENWPAEKEATVQNPSSECLPSCPLPVVENESDENDEFFDSVTSPTEGPKSVSFAGTANNDKGGEKLEDVSYSGALNLLPSLVGSNIDLEDVTITETSTDDPDLEIEAGVQIGAIDKSVESTSDKVLSDDLSPSKIDETTNVNPDCVTDKTLNIASKASETTEALSTTESEAPDDLVALSEADKSTEKVQKEKEERVDEDTGVELKGSHEDLETKTNEMTDRIVEETDSLVHKGEDCSKDEDVKHTLMNEAGLENTMVETDSLVHKGEDCSKDEDVKDTMMNEAGSENTLEETDSLVHKGEDCSKDEDVKDTMLNEAGSHDTENKMECNETTEVGNKANESVELPMDGTGDEGVQPVTTHSNKQEPIDVETDAYDCCDMSMQSTEEEAHFVEPMRLEGNGFNRPQLFKDRTISLGAESQCSEGALREDYDLDDINDILNADDKGRDSLCSDNAIESEGQPEGINENINSDETNASASGEMSTGDAREVEEKDDDIAGAEGYTKEEKDSEPEDLEQALDRKVKERSKKKSKKFKLFKKVFK